MTYADNFSITENAENYEELSDCIRILDYLIEEVQEVSSSTAVCLEMAKKELSGLVGGPVCSFAKH